MHKRREIITLYQVYMPLSVKEWANCRCCWSTKLEILPSKPTALPRFLLFNTNKKRLNVFGYLLYASEKVNNHILSHMYAFIHERMGRLSLLLEHKIGNIAVKTDSIIAFIGI